MRPNKTILSMLLLAAAFFVPSVYVIGRIQNERLARDKEKIDLEYKLLKDPALYDATRTVFTPCEQDMGLIARYQETVTRYDDQDQAYLEDSFRVAALDGRECVVKSARGKRAPAVKVKVFISIPVKQ